jgi:phospholipid N-methyltransferase
MPVYGRPKLACLMFAFEFEQRSKPPARLGQVTCSQNRPADWSAGAASHYSQLLSKDGTTMIASPKCTVPSWWDRLRADRDRDDRHGCHGELQDGARFLWEWLRDPSGTAAIAPSGRALVSLITREIDARNGAVLELGPGTGVFTRGLLARGVHECDLTLVEQNPSFSRMLQQRFPCATVLGIDAAALEQMQHGVNHTFGAAVCGLGLRNMEIAQVHAIMRAAFTRMAPGAALYLFTYSRRCSVPAVVLDELGLFAERVGTTLCNLPPASVFRILDQSAVR